MNNKKIGDRHLFFSCEEIGVCPLFKRYFVKNTALILIIILLGIAAYANSLSNDFVWDDKILVEDNDRIENFSGLGQVFKEELYHKSNVTLGYYRPLQAVSYMLDNFLWGGKPFGYHLTSIVLQVMNSILVFYLCLLVLGNKLKSLFVASVFCVHPAFVPIVSYISGRADLLGMFFSLITVYCGIKYIQKGKGKTLLAPAVIAYIPAVLSKEYYIITPLFIMLYMWIFDGSKETRRAGKTVLFSLCLIAAAYIGLRMTALNFNQEMGDLANTSLSERMMLFPYLLMNYLLTLILPLNLGMEKKLIYSSLSELRFILSYIAPLSLAWLICFFHKTKEKRGLFFAGWFIMGIIPVSNLIIPLKIFTADHWTYMASIGLFGALAILPDGLAKRGTVEAGTLNKLKLFLAIIIVALLALLTTRENGYWRNEETLFAHTVSKSPGSARTYYNIAKVQEEKGDQKKALEYYNTAIEKSNGRPQYLRSRAHLYRRMGDKQKALADFKRAAENAPTIPGYQNDLGSMYAELGMIREAKEAWRKTLELDPDNDLARTNLKLIRGR